jgi:Flp pilus assembly protein TadG
MRSPLRRFLHRTWSDTEGASALEFAIVAPVFFMLVFGILVYGYYFASISMLNHIAYEAARATVTGLSDDERNALAQARADELISAFGGFIDADAIDVDAAADGDGIYAVTVHYQFDALGLIGASSLLPLPPMEKTIKVQMSHGGY